MSNKTITISEKEADELYLCISIRLGIIETGEPMIRAVDAQRMGEAHKIKALSREKRDLINMLEDLMYKKIKGWDTGL